MSLTVTKEFVFDAAHLLTGHEGLCKNLHGHTYKVEVSVEDNSVYGMHTRGPQTGMVIDFKDLKQVLNEVLFDSLDHSFIYHDKGGQAEREIAELLESKGLKTYKMPERPTAENMVEHFARVIEDALRAASDRTKLVRIRVYETPTSFAEWLK